jgi:hypothetical protein
MSNFEELVLNKFPSRGIEWTAQDLYKALMGDGHFDLLGYDCRNLHHVLDKLCAKHVLTKTSEHDFDIDAKYSLSVYASHIEVEGPKNTLRHNITIAESLPEALQLVMNNDDPTKASEEVYIELTRPGKGSNTVLHPVRVVRVAPRQYNSTRLLLVPQSLQQGEVPGNPHTRYYMITNDAATTALLLDMWPSMTKHATESSRHSTL